MESLKTHKMEIIERWIAKHKECIEELESIKASDDFDLDIREYTLRKLSQPT